MFTFFLSVSLPTRTYLEHHHSHLPCSSKGRKLRLGRDLLRVMRLRISLQALMHALLLLRISMHFKLLSIKCLIVFLLVFKHLLVHDIVISHTLTMVCSLQLAHVLQLPAIVLALKAWVHTKSATLLRNDLWRIVALANLLLLVRGSVRTNHAGGEVALTAMGIQAASGALRSNYHVASTLRFCVLLLHCDLLLLHHLLLQMRMHLCYLLGLLLRNSSLMCTFA